VHVKLYYLDMCSKPHNINPFEYNMFRGQTLKGDAYMNIVNKYPNSFPGLV